MKAKHIMSVVVCYALLMLAFFFYSLGLEYWKTKLIPLIVSGIGFALATIQLMMEVLQRKGAAGAIGESGRAQPPALRMYFYEGGWLAGFFIGFYLLGIVSFPVFIISYLKAHGRSWGACFLFAAGMFLVSFFIFKAFRVRLPLGVILSRFPA